VLAPDSPVGSSTFSTQTGLAHFYITRLFIIRLLRRTRKKTFEKLKRQKTENTNFVNGLRQQQHVYHVVVIRITATVVLLQGVLQSIVSQQVD
jgi:hypothetical protein